MTDNRQKSSLPPDRLRELLLPAAPAPASRWGNWRDWLNLAALFFMLWVAVFSVERAQWLDPQPAFTLVLFLSMSLTWLLLATDLPVWITNLITPVVGVPVALWQSVIILPGDHTLSHLFNAVQGWLNGAELLPEEEKVVFALVMVWLVWLIGWLSTWSVLRRRTPWAGVGLGAVVVLCNLSNLSAPYYLFFPGFAIAAAWLVVQTRAAAQFAREGRGGGYSPRGLIYLFSSLICIIVLAASLAWVTPQVKATGLQNLLSDKLVWRQNVRESRLNIFNAVPSKQDSNIAESMAEVKFQGGWNQGSSLHFTVKSVRPAYWPINAYDTYSATGWEIGPTTPEPLNANTTLAGATAVTPADIMRYDVETDIEADVILAAGNLTSISTASILHRNAAGDITGVTTPHILAPGDKYSVQSVLLNPTPSQLAAAGDNYSPNILDTYLQLPDGYSPEVRALADNITAKAATPYAKAVAVIDYLQKFPYQTIIEPPPEGADGVAYFLFTQQSGFCLYFASAMAVMLRSVDVPARLVVGYLPGDPGPTPGTYLVRDWHYHAWTQVYFPGYGWVNFEATPSGGAGSGAQVSVESPLVSAPAIRDLPQWDVWNTPYNTGSLTNIAPPGPTSAASPPAGSGRPPWQASPFAIVLGWVVLVLLVLAAIAFIVWLIWRAGRGFFLRGLWHVNRDDLPYSIYATLYRLSAAAGIVLHPQQTPREFAAALEAAIPEETDSVEHLITAYQENRFGGRAGKPGLYEEAMLLKSRRAVYEKLMKLVGKRRWGMRLVAGRG